MWNHTYKEAEKGLTYHFFSDERIQLKKKMVREARCSYIKNIYHFSQEDSFLKEREGPQPSEWEMNWLRTRDGRKPSELFDR
jgi:hypothetical protein